MSFTAFPFHSRSEADLRFIEPLSSGDIPEYLFSIECTRLTLEVQNAKRTK